MKSKSFLKGIAAQFSTKSLVLIPIAVGINLIGGTLSSTLKLPLFLDMIGTTVIACLSGPWVAALCGLLTNVFLSLVANPVYLPYALSSVLCGLVVGYMVKAGLFKKIWGVILVWLACALVNTITASLVTVFVYGGATGVNGTSVDKGITVFIAYVIVRRIPKRFLSQYALDDTDDDELDDIDEDDDSAEDSSEMSVKSTETATDHVEGAPSESVEGNDETSNDSRNQGAR